MTLSLRLLREARTADKALREDHELEEIDCDSGRLFVGSVPPYPPDWRPFIEEFAREGSKARLNTLLNQRASAVLFLEVQHPESGKSPRVMAATFGQGHHSLDPNSCERNFGLRVTLNSVSRDRLRTMDTASLDATTFVRRVQSSRDADLQGFDLDLDRDLLRLAAGRASDADFAHSLAGRDSLSLTANLSPGKLVAKCRAALARYLAEDYKKEFAFIDKLAPVRETDLIDALDAMVFAELGKLVAGQGSDLHLSFPEVMSPDEGTEIAYFGFGTAGKKKVYPDLAIDDYAVTLREAKFAGTIGDIKGGHEVRVMKDGAGDKHRRDKVYDCFVYEATLSGKIYVLFGGEWYVVSKEYRDEVEADFNKLLVPSPIAAFTQAKDEPAFIAELGGASADYLILDRVRITPVGTTRANIEPCDILTKKNQFVHLKDGHGSDPISHLWSQGVVAGELFVSDVSFRTKLRAEIRKREKKYGRTGFVSLIPEARIPRPSSRGDTIIYGILRHKLKGSRKLDLPFFSKVSLRPAVQRLTMLGYRVELHLIEKRR
jgi:uncharacterized protein (TIGR04141 family)